jgi:predicted lipid-binding transport protein (Tim44 family)
MNPSPIANLRNMDDLLPLIAVMLGCSLIVLPSVTLSIARKWSASQPQLASGILGGAIAIALFGILTTAFIVLALIGWIPPLQTLLGHGG